MVVAAVWHHCRLILIEAQLCWLLAELLTVYPRHPHKRKERHRARDTEQSGVHRLNGSTTIKQIRIAVKFFAFLFCLLPDKFQAYPISNASTVTFFCQSRLR